MSETQTQHGPPFLRHQVRARYNRQIDEGSTTMDFEAWLMDEINALEFQVYALLAAAEKGWQAMDSMILRHKGLEDGPAYDASHLEAMRDMSAAIANAKEGGAA